MEYIYGERQRKSIVSVAGSAYHEALKSFFGTARDGAQNPSPVDLTECAYASIESVAWNEWKLSKRFPTVEAAYGEALRITNSLISNFCSECSVYTERISKVLSVEDKESAWVTVNGVDIPMPLHFVADLVVETVDGKTVIIDHKGKSAYTSDQEAALTHGQQAITYVLGWEAKHPGDKVDEVWFIENKWSKNSDGSPQLKLIQVPMDADSRRFYEYNLYLPLRRMIEAVSDPDYIFVTNNYDNMCDLAVLYEFSARTMVAEVDDFKNVPDDKRDLLGKRLKKIKDSSAQMISPTVIARFRKSAASFITFDYSHSNMTNTEKIEHVFRTFGKHVRVSEMVEGFSCDTYLCEAAAGVSLSSLHAYSKDVANALDVSSVMIPKDLVVYQGKSYLAIEVGKKRNELLEWDVKYSEGLRIPIGMDNFRNMVVWDIGNQSTPHVLVCGATGSGKSVMIRSTIKYAEEIKVPEIIIMDPKNEFGCFASEKGVRVYSDISDIECAMENLVLKMNERVKNGISMLTLVVFDEFADAISMSRSGKELDIREKVIEGFYANGTPKVKEVVVGRKKSLEENMRLILQKGRSVGFRVLAATQRASVKVITGDTKVNFPVQVCFRVPRAIDSKVVLDEDGAQNLYGSGDGLMRSPEYMDRLVRFQGFWCR